MSMYENAQLKLKGRKKNSTIQMNDVLIGIASRANG